MRHALHYNTTALYKDIEHPRWPRPCGHGGYVSMLVVGHLVLTDGDDGHTVLGHSGLHFISHLKHRVVDTAVPSSPFVIRVYGQDGNRALILFK